MYYTIYVTVFYEVYTLILYTRVLQYANFKFFFLQQLTSVQVVEAFICRIKEVNPKLNCCVDNRFDDALKDAAEADKLIKSGTHTEEELEKTKPYLGVPISTKDCIAVKGENIL